jgi:phosphopantetheine adenylyltransferase
MTEVIYYVATDGKQFETKEECLKYENRYSDLIKAMTTISKFCNHILSTDKHCGNCPFYRDTANECIVNDYATENWISVF